NAFEDADTTRRKAFHPAAVDCRRGHLRGSLSTDRDDCENSACKQSFVSPHYVGPPSRCSVVRSNVINEFLVQRQADVSITHCFVASVGNPGTFSSAKAQVRFRGITPIENGIGRILDDFQGGLVCAGLTSRQLAARFWGYEWNGDVTPICPRAARYTVSPREKTVKRRREKRLSAQSVGFLRSFTQLLARLPLVLLAEALTGRLRSQGIRSHQ